MKPLFFNFFIPLFFSIVALLSLSCSYDNTELDIGSLFAPTWDFSDSSQLSFDSNYVEIENGKAQLKSLDLEDSGSDFNRGTSVGVEVIDENLVLKSDVGLAATHVNSILPSSSSSLVGYWRFDDNFLEEGGRQTTEAVGGDVSLTSGKLGKSASFDGSGDYIQTTINGLSSTSGTWSVWIKDNGSADFKDYISWFADNDNYMRLERRNTNDFVIYSEVGGVAQHIFVGGTDTDSSWHHLAFTFNSNTGISSFYYDGRIVGGRVDYSSFPVSSPLFIGSRTASAGFVNADIDEVAVWNISLDEASIQKIYEGQIKNFTELSEDWAPKWNYLAGYWRMENNWMDSSSNNNHGAPLGAVAFDPDSKVGELAGLFDGLDSAIDLGSIDGSSSLQMAGSEFSFSTWIKLDGTGDTFQRIFDKSSGGSAANGYSFSVDVDSGEAYLHKYINGSEPVLRTLLPNFIGSWNHLAVTWTASEILIYLNGQRVDRHSTGPYALPPATTSNMKIGTWNHSVGREFKGSLDELAIWSTSLSSGDIKIIFERQKQKYAGHYDSAVVDFGGDFFSWPSFSWSSVLPFGKELIGDHDGDTLPDKESAIDYSDVVDTLDEGLVALWHFEKDLSDSSGQATAANPIGGVGYSDSFLFYGSNAKFDGLDDSIQIVHQPSLFIASEITVSFWIKSDNPIQDNYLRFISKPTGAGSWFIERLALNDNISVRVDTDAGVNQTQASTAAIFDEKPHHIFLTLSSGTGNLYIDGKLDVTWTYNHGSGFANSSNIDIGSGASKFFNGQIDEVAIWNRSLLPSEALSVYRRGANRVKFQIKSCIDLACQCESFNASPAGSSSDCDGDTIANALDLSDPYQAKFTGPGGSADTFYSEVFNRESSDLVFNCGTNSTDNNSNICIGDEMTLGGAVKPSSPVMSYDNFPLAARPASNPYVQYRVFMEADDNIACGTTPCLPELSSVSLNPGGQSKYYGRLREITPSTPLSYQTIESISVDADNCASFQLSPDGVSYFYFNSGSWIVAADSSQRASIDELETNIVKFTKQQGPGLLYIKAFLETNVSQTSSCGISGIDVVSTIK